jgi:arginine decarboxylase
VQSFSPPNSSSSEGPEELPQNPSTVEMKNETEQWGVDDARALYMIDRWGGGYFGINDGGEITVAPLKESGAAIPILEVVREAIQSEGLRTPMVIRFQDLVRHRVETLNGAFQRAIAENK